MGHAPLSWNTRAAGWLGDGRRRRNEIRFAVSSASRIAERYRRCFRSTHCCAFDVAGSLLAAVARHLTRWRAERNGAGIIVRPRIAPLLLCFLYGRGCPSRGLFCVCLCLCRLPAFCPPLKFPNQWSAALNLVRRQIAGHQASQRDLIGYGWDATFQLIACQPIDRR